MLNQSQLLRILRNAVVVRLAHAAECGNARFEDVVLRKVGVALLGNDDVGLKLDELVAQRFGLLLLDLEHARPSLLAHNLDVRLRLALLVSERAVEQHDARVNDAASHLACVMSLLSMTLERTRESSISPLGTFSTRTSLALDVDGRNAGARRCDGAYRPQRKPAHKIGPAHDEFGPDGGFDERQHLLVARGVNRNRDTLNDVQRLFKDLVECRDDHDGMDTPFQRDNRLCENLSGNLIMTLVVPSPYSSSCVRLSSIIFLAAGCATSISHKIVFPSFAFVRRIPPIGSRIINCFGS